MPVLCNPVLADALWTRIGGCCQYLHQQQQQQREQTHAVASSKNSSSSSSSIGSSISGPSGSREGRRRSKKSGSSSAGLGWAELDVPPDHRLLPVPGGQVAVMAQQKYITKMREQGAFAPTSLVAESELGWVMQLLHLIIFDCSKQGAGAEGIHASGLQPLSISNTTNSSGRSMVNSSSDHANVISRSWPMDSSSSWPRPTARHLQLLLEAVALTAAEGEREGHSENFLQPLNLFLGATRVASKEERGAFLAARGKLLLQVLMLVGREVDKGAVKDLRAAVTYVLETCLERGGPSRALISCQSKSCQVTSCACCFDCYNHHHSHDTTQPVPAL